MNKQELELLLSKYIDDMAISMSRGLERIDEKIDASESRTYARLAELEDKIHIIDTLIRDIFNKK